MCQTGKEGIYFWVLNRGKKKSPNKRCRSVGRGKTALSKRIEQEWGHTVTRGNWSAARRKKEGFIYPKRKLGLKLGEKGVSRGRAHNTQRGKARYRRDPGGQKCIQRGKKYQGREEKKGKEPLNAYSISLRKLAQKTAANRKKGTKKKRLIRPSLTKRRERKLEKWNGTERNQQEEENPRKRPH